MADLAVWQRTIVDEEGNVVPGAEIEVRREEDGSLATLYADRAGETPLSNPFAADMSGFVRFFAQGDAYTITAVGAGSTRTWRFDPTGRLQEFDRVSEALKTADGADTLETRKQLGTFSTVAEVENSHIPPVLESIRTFGRNDPGDGPALDLVRGSEIPGAIQSADGAWWEDVGYNTITVRIPSDFPTMQAAVDHYSRLSLRNLAQIILLLEEGYEIPPGSEQMYNYPSLGSSGSAALLSRYADHSRFTIRSEGNHIVPVADNFSGSLIVGEHAALPRLECVIDMRGRGNGGYMPVFNARGWIELGAGVINAGRWNVRLRANSFLQARGAILTGAGENGFYGAHGCIAYLRDADCSGAGNYGVIATAMAVFDGVNLNADNCRIGVRVGYCGDTMLDGASANDCSEVGLAADGACSINARGMSLARSGGSAFTASGGVHLNLEDADLSDPAGLPYHVHSGSNIVYLRGANRSGWSSTPNINVGSIITTDEGMLGRFFGSAEPAGTPLLFHGQYGLGLERLNDNAADLFETIREAGFYASWSTTTGPNGAGWAGLHLPRTPEQAAQVVVRAEAAAVDHRDLMAARTSEDATTGAWGKWRQIVHTGRIVGTVSDDSDGDPNGDIFQSGGSHPEGYILYADGTMQCWTYLDMGDPTTAGAGTHADPYRTGTVNWQYPTPKAFISRPVITLTPECDDTDAAARAMTAVFRSCDESSVTGIQVVRVTSSAKTIPCGVNIHAKGRWK